MADQNFVREEVVVERFGDSRAGCASGVARLGENEVGLRRIGEPATGGAGGGESVARGDDARDDGVVIGRVAERRECGGGAQASGCPDRDTLGNGPGVAGWL
jgi:hypothetical protein